MRKQPGHLRGQCWVYSGRRGQKFPWLAMSSDILGEKKNLKSITGIGRETSFQVQKNMILRVSSLSLYFSLLNFKGSNVCFIFSLGLVLNHMLIVKYPRIGFTNPNLTPELRGLVFKAFPNARERVGAHTGALILLPHSTALSPYLKRKREAKGKEREKSWRETQRPFPLLGFL